MLEVKSFDFKSRSDVLLSFHIGIHERSSQHCLVVVNVFYFKLNVPAVLEKYWLDRSFIVRGFCMAS